MKEAGLMLAIGTPKDKPKGSSERKYAREMYTALKDGDEDGFIEAALALKGCKAAVDDEEETEDED